MTVLVTASLESLACTFTNTFTPTGSITITKTTTGGIGTTEFAIVPTAPTGEEETVDPVYAATTTQAGVPVAAIRVSGDYSLGSFDLGQYSIVEFGPPDTPDGTWAPRPITCNGTNSAPSSTDVLVTLTQADPHVTCAFTNAFTATPPPATTTTTTAASTTTSSTVPGAVAGTDSGASGGSLAMTDEDIRLPLGIAAVRAVAGAALLLVDRAHGGVRRLPAVGDRGRPLPGPVFVAIPV